MNRRASFIPSPQPVRARLNLQRSTSRGRNRGGTQVERINPYWSDSLFSARLFSRKYLRGIIRNTEVSTGLPADPVETQNTRQVLSVGQACLDNDQAQSFLGSTEISTAVFRRYIEISTEISTEDGCIRFSTQIVLGFPPRRESAIVRA